MAPKAPKSTDAFIVPAPPEPWHRKVWNTVKHPKVAPYLGIGLFLMIGILVTVATLYPQQVTTRAVTHQAKVSVLPATLTLPPNGTLQVWTTTDSPLAFLNVEVTFDPAAVKLTAEVALSTSVWGRVIRQTTMATANTTGKIDLVIGLDPALKSATPTGTFPIATLQFGANTTASDVTTTIGIASIPSQLVATDTTVFVVTTVGSSLLINPLPTPIPTPTLTPAPTAGITPTPTVGPLPTTTPPPSDITLPVVTITTPANGAIIPAKGNVPVKVTASDASGIAKITIAVDGTVSKTCSAATSCQYNVNAGKLPAGSHTITASATDNSAAKNTASTTITVTK